MKSQRLPRVHSLKLIFTFLCTCKLRLLLPFVKLPPSCLFCTLLPYFSLSWIWWVQLLEKRRERQSLIKEEKRGKKSSKIKREIGVFYHSPFPTPEQVSKSYNCKRVPFWISQKYKSSIRFAPSWVLLTFDTVFFFL